MIYSLCERGLYAGAVHDAEYAALRRGFGPQRYPSYDDWRAAPPPGAAPKDKEASP